LQKETFNLIKEETKYLGIVLLSAIIVFKLVYFKEDVMIVILTAVSLFWMLVIPGYFLMLYWKDKLGFFERLIVGIAVSAALVGILSYYTGIIGLHTRFHGIFLPLLLIIIGVVMSNRK
jgi:uncharacterized membrane protein